MPLREERDPMSSFINALKAPETRRQYRRRIAQLPNAVLAWDVGPILTPPWLLVEAAVVSVSDVPPLTQTL